MTAAATAQQPHFFIQEYRVIGGGHILNRDDVEAAVYPFLGPYRSADDVEQARAALEKTYHDKGYQTVTVVIPKQQIANHVVVLQVLQGQVERLRVHGSRYFSIEEIKREAPSLTEGATPNFTQVTHDLVVLNGLPDRDVTPVVRAGSMPGTVDIDLNVKDTFPLHGSLEINNRYSADTDQLRLNGSVSYDNLWQLGHSASFSFQISPEDTNQVQVFSGNYLARIPGVDGVTFMIEGTSQDSNVNTLGGIGVVGTGDMIGGHVIFNLPTLTDFYQSVTLGLDYKHYTQNTNEAASSSGATISQAPITYDLFSSAYSGSWVGKGYETDMDASANLALNELGSSNAQYEILRHGATGSFIYIRGDLSHTRDLPGGFQLYAKGQGQASSEPLVPSEQFSAGGIGTVRGYLESEELGDNGAIGTLEMRSPSMSSFFGKDLDEWRVYVFSDAALLTIDDPLPEQEDQFRLASVGVGTNFKVDSHINGSLDAGLPLDNSADTFAYETRLTFRLWAEF